MLMLAIAMVFVLLTLAGDNDGGDDGAAVPAASHVTLMTTPR